MGVGEIQGYPELSRYEPRSGVRSSIHSSKPVDSRTCPVRVDRGDSRWPHFAQCGRKLKPGLPICGFHESQVRRKRDKLADRHRQRDEDKRRERVAKGAVEQLKSWGIESEPDFDFNSMSYTGKVVVDPANIMAALLRASFETPTTSARKEQK